MRAKSRCSRSSTIFCIVCIQVVNGINGQSEGFRTLQKKKEISDHAVYYHFRKWSRDGSHVIAKNGGEAVAYQEYKKAKTTNILPITDAAGFIIASTELIAGNHNDAYNLKPI